MCERMLESLQMPERIEPYHIELQLQVNEYVQDYNGRAVRTLSHYVQDSSCDCDVCKHASMYAYICQLQTTNALAPFH